MRQKRLDNQRAFLSTEALFACVYACAVQPARSKAATAVDLRRSCRTIMCERKPAISPQPSKRTCDGCRKRQEMLNEVLAHKLKEEAGRVNKHGPGVGEKD